MMDRETAIREFKAYISIAKQDEEQTITDGRPVLSREAAELGLRAIAAENGWTPVKCTATGEHYSYCPHCGAKMDEETKL